MAGGSGGSMAGGSGGNTCPLIECLLPPCPGRLIPDSKSPCACPICELPDAGVGMDAATDAVCQPTLCPFLPACPTGYHYVTPPCGCATCEPLDAGPPDTDGCAPIACLIPTCPGGLMPNPRNPCGCPICAPADAGSDGAADSTPLACVGLSECACQATSDCVPITEACYCSSPQCGPGSCKCGGGKYIGCAPPNLASCAEAKARVASLCPQLNGSAFDDVCSQADTTCAIKCFDEVGSCGDVSCAFCIGCFCAPDAFTLCMSNCKTARTQ
jgi:hypothetical protein